MTAEFAELFGPASEAIKRYVDILASRGVEWGLLGPREGDRLWDRHILNSVALAPLVPQSATVVDVGSGAGLPGIALALYRPDLRVTLLESLLRRTEFLEPRCPNSVWATASRWPGDVQRITASATRW